jgi:hypothetical protein
MLRAQFSVKRLPFSQNQCYDQFRAKTSHSLIPKRHFFRQKLGENIFKIMTSVTDFFATRNYCFASLIEETVCYVNVSISLFATFTVSALQRPV